MAQALKSHVFMHFQDMSSAFAYVDKDASGRISAAELEDGLRRLGLPLSQHRLRQIVAACDSNQDGNISYDEFCDAIHSDAFAIAALGKKKLGRQALAAGQASRGVRARGATRVRNGKHRQA